MKLSKPIWIFAGVGLLTLGPLLAPKTVHALAASLVQVSNTLANPAITLAQHKAASQLVQLAGPNGAGITPSATPTVLASYNTATSNTGSTPYVVPAGESLVITDLDFDIFGNAPDEGILLSNGNVTPSAFGQFYERFDFPITANESEQHISYQSGLVFPAGSTVAVSVAGTGNFVSVVVRGYLTPE